MAKLNIIAGFYSQLVTIATQLLAIPFIINAWGIEKYGLWVVIYAIPSVVMMFDFGYCSVAGSGMVMEFSRDNKVRATEMLAVAFYLVIFQCIVVVSLIFLLIGFNLDELLQLYFKYNNINHVIILFCIYVCFSFISGFLNSIYKSINKYWKGIFIYDNSRVLEFLLLMISLQFGGDFLEAAACIAAARVIGVFCSAYLLYGENLNNFFVWSDFKFNKIIFREMTPAAISSVVMPLSFVFGSQLTLIICASSLGSVNVAILNILRTFVRSAVQFCVIFSKGFSFDFASAFVNKDYRVIKKIISVNLLAIIAFGGAMLICVGFFGNIILSIWIKKEINLSSIFLILMGGYGFFHSINMVIYYITGSINRQTKFSALYFSLSGLFIVLSFVLVDYFGIIGVAIAWLSSELLSVVVFVGIFGVPVLVKSYARSPRNGASKNLP